MRQRSYLGLVGNGETAALISPNLDIAWLCIPRFDLVPVFAQALDPRRGGALRIRLLRQDGSEVPLTPVHQRYLGDTAILETVAEGAGTTVRAVDFMPWGGHGLVREVTVTGVGVHLKVEVDPIRSVAFPLTVAGGEVRTAAGVSRVDVQTEGAVTRINLGYGIDGAAADAAVAAMAAARAADTERFWTEWLAAARLPQAGLPDGWLESYRRSLLIMKLNSYDPTGALLAAPTASFPAVPGGGDNWDYRFTWLRDGYYTAMTFDAAGLHTEAARFYDLVFSLQGADGHWRQPLYTVDGQDPTEFIAPDLQGPGGEVPVRFGNAASAQLQLDNEGNIIHGLWYHYQCSGDRSFLAKHWDGVRRACDWIAANWRQPESGIWELREYKAHWVHGKAMCYAALDSGARIATELGYADEAVAWQEAADAVKAEVIEKGWNPERQAYLRHYGEGAPAPCVDISVLALVFYGLLPPDHPRILSTVALMEKHQSEGGLALLGGFCRYDYAAVPFYLPTLWLARYYLMAGRTADCDRLIQTCLDCATDLGLMAEHFDGETRTQWGNFPQVFSHEEMARLLLERARGEVGPCSRPSAT